MQWGDNFLLQNNSVTYYFTVRRNPIATFAHELADGSVRAKADKRIILCPLVALSIPCRSSAAARVIGPRVAMLLQSLNHIVGDEVALVLTISD